MSEETVVKIGIVSPTDAPSVSTILEEMFQFFDGRVRCHTKYKAIEKHDRLRLALMVFGDSDYARLDVTRKPTPLVVPTPKLLDLLELSRLTTNLQPLVLPPVGRRISQPEARRCAQYTRAFQSAMATRMADFLETPAAMLQMEEMGALLQGRGSNGDLVWSALKEGEGILRDEEAVAAKAVARCRPAIKRGLELQFEIGSEDIFLLREDELPIEGELLEALEISHKELQALFKAAAKLLAATNPDDRMRAKADSDHIET
jgi:hypothetical protein